MTNELYNLKRECPYAGKCGACQTLNLTYGAELSLKMKKEIALLGKFCGKGCRINEIVPMENPLNYRNKVQYLMNYNGGRVNFGLYRSSDGKIVRVEKCMMEDEVAARVCRTVKKLVDKYKLTVFDGRRGLIRHVMSRRAFATDEVLCAIVTTSERFDCSDELAQELAKRIGQVKSVSRIINDTDTPLWMNGAEEVIYGSGYITDELCGCRFRISAKSFYQINPVQTEKLYKIAADYAQIQAKSEKKLTIIDAYCGIGTVGITAAKRFASDKIKIKLIGFDINPDAVHDAQLNAKSNGLDGEYYCVGDSAHPIREGVVADVVFLDPPRAGCDRKFLSFLLKLQPEQIVYISCSPDSLARDTAILREKYAVRKITPVDMFPGTGHVETVVLMSRLEK